MGMDIIDKAAVFLLVALGLAYVSRASLVVPRSHGFYRFFVWLAILALGLLNLDAWFHDPCSWHQLISWLLLGLSAFLVIYGVCLLTTLGEIDERREDRPLMPFEKTTTLVTVGAYRHIRHPLYSSLLFLAWGVFFKAPSWVGGLLAAAASVLLVAAARAEETENIRYWGRAYEEYMARTKMLIPFVF
jgi:protein-S-isoprenylcysteine O-methyltransferase Ste14